MSSEKSAYRAAVAIALGATLLLLWLSIGLGIIGKDHNPANLMYLGVIAVGIIGALVARFRPQGMARALFATALAQALVGAIAWKARLGVPYSPRTVIFGLSVLFVVLFVGSGWLFHRAAKAQRELRAA
jgi:hypothetical protein